MIRLRQVTKVYPHMERPAVDNLSLDIQEGEICVFVGPSGCGKTTTLKMINRIIEPTGGEIFVNGENVLHQDPDELRRHIGYVIQQVGLFPHYNVYENIAVVPRLLGWQEEKIAERVDELLNLVDLDPEENKKKYPRSLSGGQSQRVGVARAMAANPPVMLMDEPFAAVDPVTRSQLQDEFLRLQKKVKKTICFVTHDIDEAIKMGDKIAIMNSGHLVQFDSPENILFSPANQFVEEFVGSDRSLKVLNLLRVTKAMSNSIKNIANTATVSGLKSYLNGGGGHSVVVNDREGKPIGYVAKEDVLKAPDTAEINKLMKPFPVYLREDSTMKDAMSDMLQYNTEVLPVIDENEKVLGLTSFSGIRSYVGQAYEAYEEGD